MATLADPRGPVGPVVDPMAPVPYRVVRRVDETADTCSLELAPVDRALDRPRPGQFVMVWAFGIGEIPISVADMTEAAEGSREHMVLTVRSVGAVSGAITATAPDEALGVRGPYGTAWPVELAAGRDVVIVAGGLGLAPLRLAIDELLTGPGRAARVTLVIGARTPDHLLYRDAIGAWAAAGALVHPTVDAAGRTWHGAVGTATAQLERLGETYDMALVCGPELMMTSAARAAETMGTPPGDVWVSLERNMHCGIAHCGRCQLGPLLLCRDGAVVRWADVAGLLEVRGR